MKTMLVQVLGSIGFLCYFLYDMNSITKKHKIINKLFFLGTLFVAAGTLEMLRENRETLIVTSVRVWVLAVFSLFMFSGLIYTLFFAIPFQETYVQENQKRIAYTEGIYALCRHPGVLWFIGMYLGIAGMIGKVDTFRDGLIYIIWDIGYVLLQDCYIFPRTFYNYGKYKEQTPFLVPNRESIRRAFKRYRKGNEG